MASACHLEFIYVFTIGHGECIGTRENTVMERRWGLTERLACPGTTAD